MSISYSFTISPDDLDIPLFQESPFNGGRSLSKVVKPLGVTLLDEKNTLLEELSIKYDIINLNDQLLDRGEILYIRKNLNPNIDTEWIIQNFVLNSFFDIPLIRQDKLANDGSNIYSTPEDSYLIFTDDNIFMRLSYEVSNIVDTEFNSIQNYTNYIILNNLIDVKLNNIEIMNQQFQKHIITKYTLTKLEISISENLIDQSNNITGLSWYYPSKSDINSDVSLILTKS